MLIIGIDPAFRKNGFAMSIMDTNTKFVEFKIFKNGYVDFVKWLMFARPDTALFIIENSNLIKKSWQKNSISVGKNQAISQITVDILRVFYDNENVIEISPVEKGKKIESLKEFDLYAKCWVLSNYKNLVCEQDKRDAFKLCLIAYNRTKNARI